MRGLKLTATPVTLEAERAMLLLKPPLIVVVIVADSCRPCGMLRVFGVTVRVKVPEAANGNVKHKKLSVQRYGSARLSDRTIGICFLFSPRRVL